MTPMTKEAQAELALREKFEAWTEEACALPWGYLKKRRTYSGHYAEHVYTSTWAVWKAATAESLDEMEAKEKTIAEQAREIDSLATVAGNNAAQVKELQSRNESAEQALLQKRGRKFTARLISTLAKDIVENLVSTDSADEEATEQYIEWTELRIAEAAGITLQKGGE